MTLMQFSLTFFFFFFNDTATTEIYTLSLHDALPISRAHVAHGGHDEGRDPPRHGVQRRLESGVHTSPGGREDRDDRRLHRDRKSTRLNSSHGYISYAVFCLKKKKKTTSNERQDNQQR